MSSGEERQNDNSLSQTPKHPTQTVDTHTLYTTFVCVLRLCHFTLLIYGTLQVASRRCRALQFMSNLVNILSPVRPVSHCFSPFSVFSPSPSPPRAPSSPPSQSPGDREKSSPGSSQSIFPLIYSPLLFAGATVKVCLLNRRANSTRTRPGKAVCGAGASCVQCVKP